MEAVESSDVFLIQPLLEEKRELESQVRQLDGIGGVAAMSDTEQDLFEQFQAEMEDGAAQIWRKTEQLHLLEEEILTLERRSADIELEIEKLYERHNVSREKADFIEECDAMSDRGLARPGGLRPVLALWEPDATDRSDRQPHPVDRRTCHAGPQGTGGLPGHRASVQGDNRHAG